MRGRKPMMLYDLYNGDKMQGKYSAAELAQRFGCSKSKIYTVEILKRILEKERQKEMLIPCGVMDCFANCDGQCSCLTKCRRKAPCFSYGDIRWLLYIHQIFNACCNRCSLVV